MSQQLKTHQLNLFHVEMTKESSQPQGKNKEQSRARSDQKPPSSGLMGGLFPLTLVMEVRGLS
jgi:hypothetical protein